MLNHRAVTLVTLMGMMACTTPPKASDSGSESKAAPADEDTKSAEAGPASADTGAEASKPEKKELVNVSRRGVPQVPPPEDLAKPPEDAVKTENGVYVKVLEKGEGEATPGPEDKVELEFVGWNEQGETFDSTEGRRPRKMLVNQLVDGWAEGIQLVHVGEKARLWIPAELGYETKHRRPNGPIVVDVKLLSMIAAPPTPEHVEGPAPDAVTTKTGLAYKILAEGDGTEHPRAWDRVTVEFTGWRTTGRIFDSSVLRGQPSTFQLDQVVPGWSEGVQMMVKGEKRRLWVPQDIAYKGRPGAPTGLLTFDVELIDFERLPEPPPPPETPKDVAAPPKSAKVTESGLAYKILSHGDKDGKHPSATDRVKVHYSGWTTDGNMFDSSVKRGQPSTFGLNQVIAGWTEGLQLLVPGDKARLWIPENLAYKGQPGKPAGMLVFDVELIGIL